jgi:hypothetical protein
VSGEDNDAIDRAFNVDALRKAARGGERAAATLLVYAGANPAGGAGLGSLVKRGVVASSGAASTIRRNCGRWRRTR